VFKDVTVTLATVDRKAALDNVKAAKRQSMITKRISIEKFFIASYSPCAESTN
jgi:hypothetical protein